MTMHRSVTSFCRAVSRIRAHGISCVLLLSLILNVAQAARLRSLISEANPGPPRGAVVPPLQIMSRDERVIDLYQPGGQPTILYFFSAACGWCERNWANAAALERGTRDRYRFLAVSASGEDVAPIVRRHRLPFELYPALSRSYRGALGLAGTPHTLVVSPDGRVLESWVGAFNGRVLADVARYFRVDLPGISE
jgi:hypothetical protein